MSTNKRVGRGKGAAFEEALRSQGIAEQLGRTTSSTDVSATQKAKASVKSRPPTIKVIETAELPPSGNLSKKRKQPAKAVEEQESGLISSSKKSAKKASRKDVEESVDAEAEKEALLVARLQKARVTPAVPKISTATVTAVSLATGGGFPIVPVDEVDYDEDPEEDGEVPEEQHQEQQQDDDEIGEDEEDVNDDEEEQVDFIDSSDADAIRQYVDGVVAQRRIQFNRQGFNPDWLYGDNTASRYAEGDNRPPIDLSRINLLDPRTIDALFPALTKKGDSVFLQGELRPEAERLRYRALRMFVKQRLLAELPEGQVLDPSAVSAMLDELEIPEAGTERTKRFDPRRRGNKFIRGLNDLTKRGWLDPDISAVDEIAMNYKDKDYWSDRDGPRSDDEGEWYDYEALGGKDGCYGIWKNESDRRPITNEGAFPIFTYPDQVAELQDKLRMCEYWIKYLETVIADHFRLWARWTRVIEKNHNRYIRMGEKFFLDKRSQNALTFADLPPVTHFKAIADVLDRYRLKVANLEIEVTKLKGESTGTQQLEDLTGRNQQLNEQLDELIRESNSDRSRIEMMAKQLEDSHATLQATQLKLTGLQSELTASNTKKEEERTRRVSDRKYFDQTIDSERKRYNKVIEELNGRIKIFAEESGRQQLAVKAAEHALADVTSKLQKAEEKLQNRSTRPVVDEENLSVLGSASLSGLHSSVAPPARTRDLFSPGVTERSYGFTVEDKSTWKLSKDKLQPIYLMTTSELTYSNITKMRTFLLSWALKTGCKDNVPPPEVTMSLFGPEVINRIQSDAASYWDVVGTSRVRPYIQYFEYSDSTSGRYDAAKAMGFWRQEFTDLFAAFAKLYGDSKTKVGVGLKEDDWVKVVIKALRNKLGKHVWSESCLEAVRKILVDFIDAFCGGHVSGTSDSYSKADAITQSRLVKALITEALDTPEGSRPEDNYLKKLLGAIFTENATSWPTTFAMFEDSLVSKVRERLATMEQLMSEGLMMDTKDPAKKRRDKDSYGDCFTCGNPYGSNSHRGYKNGKCPYHKDPRSNKETHVPFIQSVAGKRLRDTENLRALPVPEADRSKSRDRRYGDRDRRYGDRDRRSRSRDSRSSDSRTPSRSRS